MFSTNVPTMHVTLFPILLTKPAAQNCGQLLQSAHICWLEFPVAARFIAWTLLLPLLKLQFSSVRSQFSVDESFGSHWNPLFEDT